MTDEELAKFHIRTLADDIGDCVVWIGSKAKGYGRFSWRGKLHQAHRVAYEHFIGPIPHGLKLDHLCRVRGCVNPYHLEPVTNRENILRGSGPTAINAAQTRCIRGHELTPENIYPRPNGSRQCVACTRARGRARYR